MRYDEEQIVLDAIFKDIFYVIVPKSATYTKSKIEDIGIPMARDVNGNISTMDNSPTTVGLSIYDMAVVVSRGHSLKIHDEANATKIMLIIYDHMKRFNDYFDNRLGLNGYDIRDKGDVRYVINNFIKTIYDLHQYTIDARNENKRNMFKPKTLPTFGEPVKGEPENRGKIKVDYV